MSRKNKALRAFLHQNPNPTIQETWDAAWRNQQDIMCSKTMRAAKEENAALRAKLEAARAQSGPGAEVAADFRAEIRTEHDPSDEYVSYLTLIADGKSHPYLHIPESLDQSVLDEALRRLNTQPQPAQQGVPEGSRPLPVNRYGVDCDYFTKNLEILIRDMSNYTPAELARSLGRLAMAADPKTVQESEFAATPQPEADGWIKCSERFPTEADADCDGCLWVCWYDNGWRMEREYIKSIDCEYFAWMPTGLKRPQPPADELEAVKAGG